MVFFAKGLKTLPDSMCPLYANLTVHSGKSHSKAMLYLNTEISDWGQVSVCQFVIYLYVYVFIISHIWLWIILGSDLRYSFLGLVFSRDPSWSDPGSGGLTITLDPVSLFIY